MDRAPPAGDPPGTSNCGIHPQDSAVVRLACPTCWHCLAPGAGSLVRSGPTNQADRTTPGAAPGHDPDCGEPDALRDYPQCRPLTRVACGLPPTTAPIDEGAGHAGVGPHGARRGASALPDHAAAPPLLAPLDRPLDRLRQLGGGGVNLGLTYNMTESHTHVA
jgi:hypothetical protein